MGVEFNWVFFAQLMSAQSGFLSDFSPAQKLQECQRWTSYGPRMVALPYMPIYAQFTEDAKTGIN